MALTKIGATLGGSADVIQVTQSSHGLSLGYPVKVSGNGTYAHATADSATNAEAIGIIIATTTDTMIIALGGRITVDGVLPSGNLAAGTVLFLHTSAGKLTATEPSGNNEVSKPMAVITYLNSEMIMIQQRGEVITTGVIDAHTIESHTATGATGAELELLTGGADITLHSHAAAGAATTWIGAGEFLLGTAVSYLEGTNVHIPFVAYVDGGEKAAAVSTQVPSGKTGISSFKVFYRNDVASKGVVIDGGVHLLTENASATDNDDDSGGIRYVTSSTTGLIESFTLASSLFNNITTFAAGEILTLSIIRMGQAPGNDDYTATWLVLGVLITWS